MAVLHNEVLPSIASRLREGGPHDNGRGVLRTKTHPYELYLDLTGIEHRRTKVRTPKTNGFVERFNGTVLRRVLPREMRETFYDIVEAFRPISTLAVHYNTERPHGSYRNGTSPIVTVMSFVSRG